MTTAPNLCQQAFVLSLKSNQLVRLNNDQPDTKPNLEQSLYRYLKEFFATNAETLGTWDVVWGPAVYIQSSHGDPSVPGIPDNAIYVARKESSPPVYVVAVAGTNKNSQFGWVTEDGGVNTTTTWINAFKNDQNGEALLGNYGNPGPSANPCVSTGTATGVQILLSTRPDPHTNPNDPQPQRLFEYLASLPASNAQLIIAGHSLGGALSPTLALALFNPNGGPLSVKNWGSVYVLPTAGATPGNADFSNDFAAVFPAIPTQLPDKPDLSKIELWNRNIANAKDIVPLAWVPNALATIPPPLLGEGGGLYPDLTWAVGLKAELNVAIDLAKHRSQKGAQSTPVGGSTPAGPYEPLPIAWFDCTEEGDPHAHITSLLPPKGQTPTESAYLVHWALQHSIAYINQIFQVSEYFQNHEVKALVNNMALGVLAPTSGEEA